MSAAPRHILVTADLHFGLYPAGDSSTLQLAEFVRNSGADAFAIAGDVADGDMECFRACLDLFASFKGLKLLVPGNHDLWTVGEDSQKKYRQALPAAAADCGFQMLDVAPAVGGRVGFIGSIGWYDYSFRNPELNITLEQYKSKELPGVCMWNDGRFIDWTISDAEFTDRCLRKLRAAYRAVEPRVHTCVAILHHVPFRQLLYGPSSAAYEFCRAYLGSERFGELLLSCPKVRYVFCGHRHGPDRCRLDNLEGFSVGSEYGTKRLVALDLVTGQARTHTFQPQAQDASTPPGGK